MTSWLRKYCNLIRHCAVFIILASALIGTSHSADNSCTSPIVSTCRECLRRAPDCAWCSQERFLDGAHVSQRCDSAANLAKKGCAAEFVEDPRVRVEVNATLSSSQVAPREVTIQLRPGSAASVVVEVQQLDRYPVDLYYLVDVSASMQENLDRLKSVGVALSHRMREHSSDFRVGFGSFVDKPVSPYINVHPSKIKNPCSDYGVQCRPAHGFIHVLPVTENMTEFTRVIQRQQISGNQDTPEGGFDAMMQAAVCQKDIGWRAVAKHLLLVMTDQPSHLALDSKLAGIVVPHDGHCHLEDNTYTETTNMEHPTIGQLAEKLLENSIYSIFAVEQKQYKWYEDLVNLLPGTYLGKLLPQASNLKDLVVEAYKKLLSDVEVEVGVEDGHVRRFWVNVTTVCPGGSKAAGNTKCSSVRPNQTVFFNVTVGMTQCPAEGEEAAEVLVTVRPVGFNESVAVRVRQACGCGGAGGRCHGDRDPPACGGPPADGCRGDGTGPRCSGRGACAGGACVCDRSNLGSVYGRFCERDDFSCPYERGLLCGGHGQCVANECRCEAGWTGESCGCPVSTETCLPGDGSLCSGQGRCVCGRCVCDDPQRSGTFCEKCPTCLSSCQSHWRCVDCHLSHGLALGNAEQCNQSCSPLVGYVDDLTELMGEAWKHCLYPSSVRCHHRFQMGQISGSPQLHISKHPECLSAQRYFMTFLSVFVLTVVLGLAMLTALRILFRRGSSPVPSGAPRKTDPVEQFDSTTKDPSSSSYGPTANEKTITYRRDPLPDRPVEMHVHVPKMPLGEAWQ